MNEEQAPLSDATAEAPLPPVPAPDTESAAPRVPFDPYDGSRHLPWMDRSLSPLVRAARRMRPELKGFAAIEGRPVDPSIGPRAQPIGGNPSDMRRLARLSRESSLLPRSGGSAPEGRAIAYGQKNAVIPTGASRSEA